MKILSKIIGNTETTRMSLGISILEYIPDFPEGQNAQIFLVQDEEGIVWRFRLIIRSRGRYRKPVLSAGWSQFVKSKRLQSGFKVQFFREVDEATGEFVYRIKMKKPVVVFNSVLGYAPYLAG